MNTSQFLKITGFKDSSEEPMLMYLNVSRLTAFAQYSNTRYPSLVNTSYLFLSAVPKEYNDGLEYGSCYSTAAQPDMNTNFDETVGAEILEEISKEIVRLSNVDQAIVESDYINSLNWRIYDF